LTAFEKVGLGIPATPKLAANLVLSPYLEVCTPENVNELDLSLSDDPTVL